MKNIYTLFNAETHESRDFESSREAGAAFFNEPRNNRPYVIETTDGTKGRSMAFTQIHGEYDNGDQKFVKILPDSHENDSEFRAGYTEALEKSIKERLKQIDWKKYSLIDPAKSPRLDNHLNDDIETLVVLNPDKAIKIWEVRAPEWATFPMDQEVNAIERLVDPDITQHLKISSLGQQAEGKRITVENLSEKATEQQNDNRLAEHTGAETDYSEQLLTEREKNRQVVLMEQVHQQFRVSGAKFYFKDHAQRVAFTDKGLRMVSPTNDERVSRAMVTMVEAKGWKTIRVSGHPDFQREVWMEATLRGIRVRGFKPQEQDLKELESRSEARSKNMVEHEATGERQRTPGTHEQNLEMTPQQQVNENLASNRAYTGRVLDHGAAPYNFDQKEKANYFVKLATDKGEQTIWGVDLNRAMVEAGAQKGDDVHLEHLGKLPVKVQKVERDKDGKIVSSKEIEVDRNTWDIQLTDKSKVVKAVAAEVLAEKGYNSKQRDEILQAVSSQLKLREQQGKVPMVPIYDKEAPLVQKQPEQIRPQIDRNAERTR